MTAFASYTSGLHLKLNMPNVASRVVSILDITIVSLDIQ